MTMRFPACRTCGSRLDGASVLCQADTCCECERKRILLAVDPWALFVRTLRANVRSDGTVHACDIRPLVRGRIEPRQLSSLWRRAQSKSVGLIRQVDVERSDDVAGKNAGRPEPVYKWTGRAA